MSHTSSRLAIAGGEPIRTEPIQILPPDGLWPLANQADREALLAVLDSGAWCRLNGSEAEQLEADFAAFTGAKYALAVANGTVSLQLALLAAGIEAGDEVIVPPYTFIATAASVINVNATPIFVDIDPATFNLAPARIAEAITPRTRAIMPVHMAGVAADMAAINDIAQAHNLVVIEDAAHAHGGTLAGRALGTLGEMGSLSFQLTKNLTAGEGGMVLTDNEAFFEIMDSIQNLGRGKRGQAQRWQHVRLCANFRITEFQAALLRVQLTRLAGQTATRDRNGRALAAKIAEIPGFVPQAVPAEQGLCPYHLWAFRHDPEHLPVSRDLLIRAFQAEGIPVSPLYATPLYRQPLFVNKEFGPFVGYRNARPDLDYTQCCCPVTEQICAQACFIEHPVLLQGQDLLDDIGRAFEKIHACRDQLTGLDT